MRGLLLFLFVSFVGLVAMAQSIGVTPDGQILEPNVQEVSGFIQSLGGWKTLGAMGVAILTVQGLLLAFRSKFLSLDPKIKLLVVLGLTWVLGILALMSSGLTFAAALLHSNTMAAMQVFVNQLYQKFTEPKVETKLAN